MSLLRRRHDDDFAEEVQAHLALETEQLVSEGMEPIQAHRTARRSFGNDTRLRERFYETNRWMWLDHLVRDVRFALRQMKRSPISTFTIVASLALGIGACTAIYGGLRPLILQELPFKEADRLVWIANDGGEGMSGVTSRTSNLRDFRALNQTFDGLTGYFAFFEQGSDNLVGKGEPIRLIGVDVAHDFLDVLGVQPLHGRNFTQEEGVVGGPPTVILTHAFWQRQFAGDPDVVNTAITISNEPNMVIGVLPAKFDFSSLFAPRTRVDFLRPFPISDETDRWGNTLSILGRLAPGVSVESAESDLHRIIEGLEEADPERWGLGAKVTGMQAQIAAPFRTALFLLAGAAGAVLLIVCLNISNMLLAKGPRRSAEMSVRSALGAPRFRLVRQLLIESLMLSLLGSALGALFAFGVTRFVANAQGLEIPLLRYVTVDGGVLLFTTLLAAVVGVVVGIVPALQISRVGQAAADRGARRSMSASRRSSRWREALVVAEVALACILLVFGGLLVRSFQRVLEVDLGFDSEQVVSWTLDPSRSFDTREEAISFYEEVVEKVAAIPSVAAVGLTDAVPLGRNRTWNLGAPGLTYEDDKPNLDAFPHLTDSRYLEAMKIRLVEGRLFTPEDSAENRNVIVLNESAAQAIYHGEEVLGRKVIAAGDQEFEIVGVVADTRHRSLELEAGYEMYLPIAQIGNTNSLEMVVRSQLPPDVLGKDVARALRALDPAMPANEYRSLSGLVDRSVSPRRFTLQILIAFAVIALLLAALGIYGVLSYSVTERRPEIGIRMALGETGVSIVRRVVGRTMTLAVMGLALGLVGSFAVSRWVSSLLFGIDPVDPGTYLAMAAILLVVAALAGLLPALRAARTNASSVLWAS